MRVYFIFNGEHVSERSMDMPPRRTDKIRLPELKDDTDTDGRVVVSEVIWDVVSEVIWDVELDTVDVHLVPEETA